jgi:hypothetical protein
MPSKIIKDLKSVPNIVGELGLNIAAAQKALNHDYVQNLDRILGVALDLIGKTPAPPAGGAAPAAPASEALDIVKDVIRQLAPVRYVFTETSLAVRLDLAQSFEGGAEVGLGGGVGAVMVNASLSLAFAQDYRGTAECRTVIHVDPRSAGVNDTLTARAKELSQQALPLANLPQVDKEIFDSLKGLRDKLK